MKKTHVRNATGVQNVDSHSILKKTSVATIVGVVGPVVMVVVVQEMEAAELEVMVRQVLVVLGALQVETYLLFIKIN